MKNIIAFLVFIFYASTFNGLSQGVTNSSISGVFTEYKTLTGSYDEDLSTLNNHDITYQWFSYDEDGNDEELLTSTDQTLELLPSLNLLGRRIKFVVTLTSTDPVFTGSDESALSQRIIANSAAQVAPNPAINEVSGNMNVGSILLADYVYSDADGDPEGLSIFEWFTCNQDGSGEASISDSNSSSYIIKMVDEGEYFKYKVRPVAATGNTAPGTLQTSTVSGKVNERPRIDNLAIETSVSSGDTIHVTYDFHDPDSGDDDASTFRWFKDGVEFINQSDIYTTIAEDQGSDFYVIIKPVSDNGYPNTGDDVTSDTCTVSVSAVPVATSVCIKGNRSNGAWLEGHFTYIENGTGYEGDSYGEWLVDGDVVQAGSMRSNQSSSRNRYQLNGDTVDIEDIVFRITPKRSETVVGVPVSSAALAKISNVETSFSIIEPPVILGALPEQGVFSSNDAIINLNGSEYSFDPSDTANFDIDLPILIQHSLETTAGGCVQKDWITFNVNAATTYFTNDQDIYCSTTSSSEIDVEGLPVDYLGGGMFNIYYSDGYSRPASFSQITDRKVRIYPAQIPPRTRPGGPTAKLSYRYAAGGPLPFFPIINYEIIKDLYVDSIGVYLAITNVDNSYCENDDTVNIGISNFYPTNGTGTWDCLTTDILRNEDNFSATLDPSLKSGGGLETIQYTYTIPGGCSKQVSAPLTIHPKPQLDFSIVDGCIEHDSDTTWFDNKSPDSLLVDEWLWEFGEVFPSISDDFEPGYMYRTEGERDVTLIGTTLFGCSDTLVNEIGLGVKPEGDFYWKDDCFNPSQDLKLFDSTKPTSTIESSLWKITHSGGDTLIPDVLNPTFPKTLPEVITVNYYLFTAYPGCEDVVTKNIYIRPMYSLSDSVYYEDFEGSGLAWVKEATGVSTWEHGIPDYHTTQPDGMSWYTGTLIEDTVLVYAVESPCFDFRGLKRPMIKMDIIRAFDKGRDGAVLQYKEGNDAVWRNIGSADFGINWYRNSNISGKPGGSVVGWSPELKDDSFQQARQYLDDLIDSRDVIFRISYGSDGNAIDSKGFAFDNIWIGERSRKVLVEHFTNYNYPGVVDQDIELNRIIDDAGEDAMNIQYHTNYRYGDSLYLDNTAVPSARMLFYSLVRNPFTLFDGGTGSEYAKKYDWDIANANLNDLKNRSLTDPLFYLHIDTLPNYRFNVSIKPLEEIHSSNMTLYLAVVAREINELEGSNGQTVFRNVLRKMIPDAGGISLDKDWYVGDSISRGPFSRNISMEFWTDSVEVIAFLQNNITKEVYQAASSGKLSVDIATSIGKVGFEEATFKIFPNPASTNLTILFDQELTGESELRFYNNTGVVVKEVMLEPGIDRLTIDDVSLPSGIYIVKLTFNKRTQSFRKLIITGQ